MKFNKSFLFLFLSFLAIEPLKGTNFKVANSSVRASESLGKVKLTHNDNKGFALYENGTKHEVGRHSLSPELRTITSKELKAFQKAGYLSVNKQSDGEFAIRSHVRGEAGGPIAGAIAYWITKSLCYGTAVAAAGTAVVATGGVVGAIGGGLAAGATLGASAGATVVGGVIAGSGVAATQAATALTVGAVTQAGGLVAAAAVVEGASIAAAGFFTAIPFLP